MYIEKSVCGGLFVGSGLLKINECVRNTAKDKSLSIHQDHKSIKKNILTFLLTENTHFWHYLQFLVPSPPVSPYLTSINALISVNLLAVCVVVQTVSNVPS